MTKPQREEALDKIKTSKKTSVILISFKAGSTGTSFFQYSAHIADTYQG